MPFLVDAEVNLGIPKIHSYNEDMLTLMGPNTLHGERVPGQIGLSMIDQITKKIILQELENPSDTWKQAHFHGVIECCTN